MRREIKFRAWDKQKKKMLHTSEGETPWVADENFIMVTNLGVMVYSTPCESYYGGGDWDFTTGDFEYMQFSGLKDKNDVEIYEGDVVACESSGINRYEHRVVCYDLHQARYKEVPLAAYHLNAGNGGWTGYELKYYHEVIGNIYENPELLTQEGGNDHV